MHSQGLTRESSKNCQDPFLDFVFSLFSLCFPLPLSLLRHGIATLLAHLTPIHASSAAVQEAWFFIYSLPVCCVTNVVSNCLGLHLLFRFFNLFLCPVVSSLFLCQPACLPVCLHICLPVRPFIIKTAMWLMLMKKKCIS